MAARGYFSHDTPEGKKPWQWIDEVGYEYQYSGQNLAVNFTESKEVQEAWMNSPTHRANIVKPQYTEIGIGTAEGMYKGEKVTFVVQFFATPMKAAPVRTQLAADVPAPRESLSVTDLTPRAAEEAPTKEPEVAGEQTGTEQAPERLAQALKSAEAAAAGAATSPSRTLFYVLWGVVLVAVTLLLIGAVRHARLPYFEVVGGAFVIILIALAVIYVNQGQESDIEIAQEAVQVGRN